MNTKSNAWITGFITSLMLFLTNLLRDTPLSEMLSERTLTSAEPVLGYFIAVGLAYLIPDDVLSRIGRFVTQDEKKSPPSEEENEE